MKLRGKCVKVYRNLRKGCYSVMFRGRVVAHVHRICLGMVEFRVNEKGRQRVLAECRKNVHAFVVGMVVDDVETDGPPGWAWVTIRYNPYRGPKFYRAADGQAVAGAQMVRLGDSGIMAYGLRIEAGR